MKKQEETWMKIIGELPDQWKEEAHPENFTKNQKILHWVFRGTLVAAALVLIQISIFAWNTIEPADGGGKVPANATECPSMTDAPQESKKINNVEDIKSKQTIEKNDNKSKLTKGRFENIHYVYGEDGQCEAGEYPTKAYISTGYYYLDMNLDYYQLMYFDYDKNDSVIVCDKANCSHKDEQCNGYFSNDKYPVGSIWTYKDEVYVPYYGDGYYCLMKIASDGSIREKSCTIARIVEEKKELDVDVDYGDSEKINYPIIALHRGYAYISSYYPGCSECNISKVKLNSNEKPKVLYSVKGNGAVIYRMKGYGDYMFFQSGNFSDDNVNFAGGLYMYNIRTGKTELVSDGIIKNYVIGEDGNIYYDKGAGKVYRNSASGDELFFDTKTGDSCVMTIMADGDKIICNCEDENPVQYVLNLQGDIVSEETNMESWILPYQAIRR